MTTLAESFLADLDDLSDASDHEQVEEQDQDDADQVWATWRRCMFNSFVFDPDAEQAPVQMVVDDIEALNYDSLEAVAHLRASERYKDIMQVGCCYSICVCTYSSACH